MLKIRLSEMTHREVAEVVAGGRHVALLPVGATEQHGPHLPLDVDARIAVDMCEAAARAVLQDVRAVVAPPLVFGISEHHMAFPGTLALTSQTFVSVAFEVGRSLVRHGLDRIVIVNGHGANRGALQAIAQRLKLEAGAAQVIYVTETALGRAAFMPIRKSARGGAGHACEYETSLYLYLRPELVQMEHAVREIPSFRFEGAPIDMFDDAPFALEWGYDYSTSGVYGDPTVASPETGREIFDGAVALLADLLRRSADAGIE